MTQQMHTPTSVPEYMPERLVRDLQETGGKNIATLCNELTQELNKQIDKRRSALVAVHNMAVVIAASLEQPESSESHRLAIALLEDYQRRNREMDSFSWGDA